MTFNKQSETPSASEPKASRRPEDKADESAERGGPKGPEPTRYGDWETNGRCTDF